EGSTSNSASIAPVAITSPGPPASLRTLPDTGEGTSTTALAVSIDTRFSSRRMVSPSLTNHSTMVASGRPSPRSGSLNTFLSAMSFFRRAAAAAMGSSRADRGPPFVPSAPPRARTRVAAVLEQFELVRGDPAGLPARVLRPPPAGQFVVQGQLLAGAGIKRSEEHTS